MRLSWVCDNILYVNLLSSLVPGIRGPGLPNVLFRPHLHHVRYTEATCGSLQVQGTESVAQTWCGRGLFIKQNDIIILNRKFQIKLEVQYSPQITQTASFDDPYYLDPSERPGVKFTPTCIVEAWPNATVKWFKDGNKLPENDQIEIKDDGVYYGYPLTQMGFSSIKDAVNSSWSFDEAKLGVYECRAQNYIGTTTAAFNIFRRCDITGLQCWCDMTRASCLEKIKNVN